MDRNEAIWIAISALNWVIGQCQSDIKDQSDLDHINEKNQALEILMKEVK